MRHGLVLLINAEPEFDVVAEAGDLESTKRQVMAHHPDVLLLDMNMPGGSVVDAIPQLRIDAPQTQIVMITMSHEPAAANAALRAGAIGYVFKDAADDELFDAIRHAAAGQRHVSQQLASRMSLERIRRNSWD